MKLPEPVAWWNGKETAWFEHELDGYKPPPDATIPLFTEAQIREVINSAAQICQRWIDDHSKADNCTYNDCDMVAAVTDVMNEIKGMME